MTNDCDNLNAYVDGELTPGESARFAAHLDACPTCREAVDEQQWIDGLLRAPASAQLESPRPQLVVSIRSALARRIRTRRLATVAALAAAAALLVGVGWMTRLTPTSGHPEEAPMPQVAQVHRDERTPFPPLPKTPSGTSAEFVAGSAVIVMPVESAHSNVTIVRVYPVWEPDFSTQASINPHFSGDAFAEPDLNGG